MSSSLGRPPQLDDVSLDGLPTEAGSDPDVRYDLRPTVELVELMALGDATVPGAVAAAARQIAAVVDAVAGSLRAGGRLIYVGAGSSGRIAALDAAECESTFSSPPGNVVSLIAGGAHASPLEQEAAEDDRAAGFAELSALDPRPEDVVVAVSASGRTPYVLGALAAASEAAARTACVVSVQGSPLERAVESPIVIVTGPEFIAGSTRLKAGTAQKLVLNAISTLAMVRLGKTFGNLMVDVAATNDKLRARVRRIVGAATGAAPEDVDVALAASGGEAKVAIVSLLAAVDASEARARLAAAEQQIGRALER